MDKNQNDISREKMTTQQINDEIKELDEHIHELNTLMIEIVDETRKQLRTSTVMPRKYYELIKQRQFLENKKMHLLKIMFV